MPDIKQSSTTFTQNVTLGDDSNDDITINGHLITTDDVTLGNATGDSIMISGSTYLADDAKLIFGTGPGGATGEASIVYEETTSNQLIISGALTGTVLSMPINCDTGFNIVSRVPDQYGSDMMTSFMKFDTTTDEEEITVGKHVIMRGGDIKVESDYHNGTFENNLDNGSMGTGHSLYYGPAADTSLTKGQLYYLKSDGVWTQANASAAGTAHAKLLAIALGTSARNHGMLLRGFIRIPATEVLHVPGSGATDGLPVYVSSSNVSGGAAGHFDFTAPSAGDDVLRVVGYCIDDDSGSILLWFDASAPGEVLD